MNKLDMFNVYDVSMKANKNGGFMIKIGDNKIPYNHHDANSDYMKQAIEFVADNLKYQVIGTDGHKIVASQKPLKVITLFEFKELSDKSKSKALLEYQNESEFFDDTLIDGLTEMCEELGFNDIDIEYSLSYSHIPYAKLTGTYKKPKHFAALKSNYNDDELLKIIDALEKLPDDFESDDITNELRLFDIMALLNKFLFKSVESEYNYQQSDDHCIEMIEANEYYFDVDGKFIS